MFKIFKKAPILIPQELHSKISNTCPAIAEYESRVLNVRTKENKRKGPSQPDEKPKQIMKS